MREVSIHRCLLIHLPDTHTLIVRTTDHHLIICGDNDRSDPFFMTLVGTCVEPSTDLPQLDGLVTGTADEKIAIHHKIYITYIVIVPVECLAAYIIAG
jgi:hypothetical protein